MPRFRYCQEVHAAQKKPGQQRGFTDQAVVVLDYTQFPLNIECYREDALDSTEPPMVIKVKVPAPHKTGAPSVEFSKSGVPLKERKLVTW